MAPCFNAGWFRWFFLHSLLWISCLWFWIWIQIVNYSGLLSESSSFNLVTTLLFLDRCLWLRLISLWLRSILIRNFRNFALISLFCKFTLFNFLIFRSLKSLFLLFGLNLLFHFPNFLKPFLIFWRIQILDDTNHWLGKNYQVFKNIWLEFIYFLEKIFYVMK